MSWSRELDIFKTVKEDEIKMMNAKALNLDIVLTNTKVNLRITSDNSLSTFNFSWDFVRQFVTPQIESWFNNHVGLGTKLFKEMAEVLNKDAVVCPELPALLD